MSKYSSMTKALKDINIKKVLDDNDLWNEIGKTQVENTRAAQAQGKGADAHGSGLKKFESLAASTVRQRKREQLSTLTKPAKSNLIESGQMHSDLTHEIGRREVSITHKTSRSKEIASYHESGGGNLPRRAFMNMSKSNIKSVKNILLKYLDKIFKGA
jgi:hypothetical protein